MQDWIKICQIKRVLNNENLLVKSGYDLLKMKGREVFLVPPFLCKRRCFKLVDVVPDVKQGQWCMHLNYDFSNSLKFELPGHFLLARNPDLKSDVTLSLLDENSFDMILYSAGEVLDFEVIDDTEGRLGVVVNYFKGAMQSRITVKLSNQVLCEKFGRELGYLIDIPFVKEICYECDASKKQIRANIPKGLFKL